MSGGPYRAVFAAGWRSQAAYRLGLLATGVSSALTVTVLVSVWAAVYAARGGRPAGAYTADAMTAYLVAANLLALLVHNEVDVRLAGEVYRGDHITGLVRPVSYLATHAALGLAAVLLRLTVVAVPLAVLAGLLLDLTPPTALGLLLGLVSAALATAIAISANLIVGMAGFVTTNTWGVRYLYSTVQAALSGQLVALELMPAGLRSTVGALPFAAMVSTPTRLLLGRYDRAGGAAVLLLGQAGWLIALTAVAVAAWRGASRADSAAVGG